MGQVSGSRPTSWRTASLFLMAGLSMALSGLGLTGCSAASTDVQSLLPHLGLFSLDESEIRIQNLSELSTITLEARCNSLNSGFEFDFSNTTPEVWVSAPSSTPSGVFSNISDTCASAGRVVFTLDLSTTAPFSTMSLNQTLFVKVRDLNALNFSTTESFRITYSFFTLDSERLILGQGANSPLCSGGFCLRGRLTKLSDLETSTSGSYSLQGKVVFQ